jgi:hypothetical protein
VQLFSAHAGVGLIEARTQLAAWLDRKNPGSS